MLSKAEVRENISAIRKNYSEEKRKDSEIRLLTNFQIFFQDYIIDTHNVQPLTVAAYYPIKSEINPLPIISWLQDQHYEVLLPVIGQDKILGFRVFDGNLKVGRFGILEPMGVVKLPDIILSPLVAYDVTGLRIGYGGGYYDCTIDYYENILNHKTLLIGLAYSFQEVAQVCRQSTDKMLMAVITECSIQRFVT